MIRHCPLRLCLETVARRVSEGRLAFALIGGLALCVPVVAADLPALSAARLKELATDAIRTGKVHPIAGKTQIEGDSLTVSDSGTEEEGERDAENPYVRVFLDQVGIDVRRQYLLKRDTSRRTIEPYYAKMEQVVAKKLAVVEVKKLSDDDRAEQIGKLDEQMHAIYNDGLQAVAKSLGLKEAVFLAGAALNPHPVKLTASQGATIDMVRQTTASLLKDAGQAEQSFPWTSYQAGDTPDLLGVYYCRIRLGDKQATLSKTVAKNTNELRFPDP
jgi:hypothetical protein